MSDAPAPDPSGADADARIRTLVHDLRTPTTIIAGFSELLLAQDAELAPGKRREYLQRIDAAATDLRRLLDDAR